MPWKMRAAEAATADAPDGVREPLLLRNAAALGEGGDHAKHRRGCGPRRRRRLLVGAASVVAVLVVGLVVVQSQMRRLATAAIAATTMRVARMELTRPRTDGLTVTLDLAVTSPSAFGAALAPTTFAIAYGGATVGAFAAPAMTIPHGASVQRLANTTLRITNATAWAAFARDLMESETLTYSIRGEVALSVALLGGLVRLHAAGVPLAKDLASDGMGGLRVMDIAAIDMTHSTSTAVLASIKTCLRNPSTVTIRPVGRLCMLAHAPPTPGEDTLVARLTTPAAADIAVARDDPSHPYCAGRSTPERDLRHGYNLLEMTGHMLGTHPEAISALISQYLSHVPARMTVVACPRATSIDIFDVAMQGLRIPAVLPPRDEPLVGRLFFQSIRLNAPTTGTENQVVTLATGVTVEALSPLGPSSALELKEIQMRVDMYAALNASGSKTLLGGLSTDQVVIQQGRLVEVSNISVQCAATLALAAEGRPFGAFVRESVKSQHLSIQLRGTMDVVAQGALGTLKLTGLPMDVLTNTNGMDDLRHVAIEEFNLPGAAAQPRGEVLTTKIDVWNPSLFSVDIGKVRMAMELEDGSHLGDLAGLMDLRPGHNHLRLRGQILPDLDASGRVSAGVSMFFSRYLQGKESLVSVTVVQVEYRKCLWMTKGLVGLKIRTMFPGVASGFELISGLDMRQLDVILEPNHVRGATPTNTTMRVRTDLAATLLMPPTIAIPINVSQVSVALGLEDFARSPLGRLQSASEACEYRPQGGFFRLNMSHYYPVLFADHQEAASMSQFIKKLLVGSSGVTMRIVTQANSTDGAYPEVETRMGKLALSGIPIDGAPVIPGMNSFRSPPVKILEVNIVQGSVDSMELEMKFEIINPSIVRTALGNLSFDVLSESARMGTAKMTNFQLRCCEQPTVLAGTFTFAPHNSDIQAATRFLSNFVCGYFTDGGPQQIFIAGSSASTQLDVLQPALSSLKIPTQLRTLPDMFPMTPSLVTSSMLYTPSILHLNMIPTALQLRNPFSENITVTSVDLLLYPCEVQRHENDSLVCDAYYTQPLARFAPRRFEPIFIPAKSAGCYSCCQGAHCETKLSLCPRASVGHCMTAEVAGFFSAEAIAALFHTATTGLLMRVNGTISAAIGAYETELFYRQEGLLVTMAKLF